MQLPQISGINLCALCLVLSEQKSMILSGLHTNYSLMEELIACKKAVGKVVPGAPNVS